MERVALRDGALIEDLRKLDALQWFAELGLGYYPGAAPLETVYGNDYFAKYVGYSQTHLGERLNRLRMALVRQYCTGDVVDVGIGCGSFVWAMQGQARGYDISQAAVRWLMQHDLFRDPYKHGCYAATFWDSLEHIENFPALLARVRSFVFMSLPIFDGPEHVLRSRHYRKDEHCWYFTEGGLTNLMARLGWTLIESNDAETKAGRDGIGSFAFRREVETCRG
jgi:hypothetical protein